ncbi:MAG: hypothetical protein AAGF26_06345 [Cyanobacteria bacterium P01_G01_bin.49]
MMYKLKLLSLSLIFLSIPTFGALSQSVLSKSGVSNSSSYEISQLSGDGEEPIEDAADTIDTDNIDQQPVYDGQPGEEAIEDTADVIDSDNIDQTPVDSKYNVSGEDPIEDTADTIDADNIDQQPVYDGQPGEEAIKDAADEMDADNIDQVEDR